MAAEQPRLDWDRDVSLPVSGRTPAARHASATGAQAGQRTHGRKGLAYLEALERAGAAGLNDFDAGQVVGIYRTSVNSVRAALMRAGLVEETGAFDVTEFGTRRQRYRLTAAGRVFVGGAA